MKNGKRKNCETEITEKIFKKKKKDESLAINAHE